MTPYITFLKYCLSGSNLEGWNWNGLEWENLLSWASRQAIVGVVFEGIERLGEEISSIPLDIKMQWIYCTQIIEQQNQLVNIRSCEIVSELERNGFRCCILKGQGNSMMYPNQFRRISGDIDVWIKGRRIQEVIVFAKRFNSKGKACYHHVDYGIFKDVEVELHYRPTFMNNLIANRRMQRWIKKHEDEQFCNKIVLPRQEVAISVPTWEFNVVFQLSHIYRHVIQSGVGLRQIIDYYYLLKSDRKGENEGIVDTLKSLGLLEIAGAVMWVMKEKLGMEEVYLIAPVDVRRGRFLYEDIMQGGNFGFYSKRVKQRNDALQKNINRLKRDMRLVKYFPSECLWEPVFRIYHFVWRLGH